MIKRPLICIIVIVLLLLLICIYLTKGTCIVPQEVQNSDIQEDYKVVLTESNFKLESEYISENSWEYTVTGELPNPCYNASVDAMVAESYPEQVTITVTVEQPDPEVMCAQVIQEFTYEGTFSASEKATIKLFVN